MDDLDLIIEASLFKLEQAEVQAQGEAPEAPQEPQPEEAPIPEQGPDVQPEEAAPQGTEMGMDPSMAGGMEGMEGMDQYGMPEAYEPPDQIEEPLNVDEIAPDPKKINPITLDD